MTLWGPLFEVYRIQQIARKAFPDNPEKVVDEVQNEVGFKWAKECLSKRCS